MFLYKVGYHSCEDSNYQEYIHKKRFNDKQFKALISKALVSASGLIIQDEIDFCNNLPRIKLSANHFDLMNFDNFIDHSYCSKYRFKEEFIKLGFIPVEYQSSYSVFGWTGVFSDHFGSECTGFQKKIKTRIRKQIAKLYPKIWKKVLKFQAKERLQHKKWKAEEKRKKKETNNEI